MADYDRIGREQEWVPYLMKFCRPDCAFDSVSTDSMGFRTSLDRERRPLTLGEPRAGGRPWSIVAGGSAVFGVGATSDAHTIPSILNRTTGRLWLNFGGRAFNSTQELILLLLHLPEALDRVVLVSGVNNIFLASLNDRASPVYGTFFNQSVFERAMTGGSGDYVGVRRSARQLLDEIRHRLAPHGPPDPTEHADGSSRWYHHHLDRFRLDLRAFKLLASGLGARLDFALQPLANWIDKKLSPEEQELFGILDKLQGDTWRVQSESVRDARDRYFADVAGVCEDEGIAFCNLNLDPTLADQAWLFVDRVHLTDRGHALVAEIIVREFAL